MASITKVFQASTASELQAAINTYLTANVTKTIKHLTLAYEDQPGVVRGEYTVVICLNDGYCTIEDGAAPTIPWQVGVFESKTVAQVATLVDAFTAAHPTYALPGARMVVHPGSSGRMAKAIALVPYCTAANASGIPVPAFDWTGGVSAPAYTGCAPALNDPHYRWMA